MDFVGKGFSEILWLMGMVAAVLIGGYLLIHLIPLFIIAGVVIYAIVMGKRYFKKYFKKSESKINMSSKNNYNNTSAFTSSDVLDGEVIDVDYKDV